MDLEALINQHYRELNESDLQILSYIIQNKEKCKGMTIIALAQETLTSKSTISRLVKKIGFSGYSEFKYSLKNETKKELDQTVSNFSDTQREDITNTLKLFNQTNCEPIIKKIHQAERIFCYGTGWGQRDVLSDLRRSLIVVEKFPIVLSSKKELEIASKVTFTKGDLLIVVSLSGDIQEVKNEMNVLTLNGIDILSITSLKNNSLASLATYNLYFQSTPALLNGIEIFSFLPVFLITDSLCREYIKAYQSGKI
ncbi:MurR/RpiR family transcriptional regulator [Carnobacterium sp.]|uniref:MurR/RpiR family transcriptional regulator n=1 Tax=Carnobacterium sp. TaxID=48221 RepID=UPI0028AFDFE9|nr:MurR/RpiR family transcriptional regulator [Carnobacterium sp.]